ncbi:MAG: hypothetical protein KGK30_06785, partial [Elusimicrobia bacterium]|nr:hypothetical protein [Elusimicrobiota bacterium]
ALLVSIFILALAGSLAALSCLRVLSSELEARRPQPLQPPAAPAFGPLPAMEGEIVGDNGLPSLSGGAESAASRGGQPARLGQRFDFLAPLNPEELAALLAEESVEDLSQLLAALAKTGPDLASLVFAALPAALQPRVSQTLATLRTSDPDRLSDIEATLRERSERMVRGAERLGAILSRLPPQQREGLLGDIVVSNPDLAARVEKAVFSFEDILRLPPIELRRLLSAMPYEEWGIALQGAPQPLVDAVVGQLPEGAAEALRESLAASVPSARVLSARSRALDRARALIEEGQIASAAAR